MIISNPPVMIKEPKTVKDMQERATESTGSKHPAADNATIEEDGNDLDMVAINLASGAVCG